MTAAILEDTGLEGVPDLAGPPVPESFDCSPALRFCQVSHSYGNHHLTLGLDVLDGQSLGVSHWLVLAGYTLVLAGAIVWKHRAEEARGLA